MEIINKDVYKNHRIIEFKNDSKIYNSTFIVLNGESKCLTKIKSRNSIITLKRCKSLIDDGII